MKNVNQIYNTHIHTYIIYIYIISTIIIINYQFLLLTEIKKKKENLLLNLLYDKEK